MFEKIIKIRINVQITYMSGFLRTVTELGQNIFACLRPIAGREAFAVLGKPGRLRQGGLAKTSQVSGYQLVPRGGPRAYPLGGGEGHRKRHFAQQNCFFSLQQSLWQSCLAGLVSGSQPARHKKGG